MTPTIGIKSQKQCVSVCFTCKFLHIQQSTFRADLLYNVDIETGI